MFHFTREISVTLRKNACDRANYLWNLFSQSVEAVEGVFYCDIGAGFGDNTLIFGRKARNVLAIDVKFPQEIPLKNSKKVCLIVADARFLPLKKELLNMVSLFSVIEHIKDKKIVLHEALRVLKSSGYLIIQIPNKCFPLDLHTGLPFIFFIPWRIREAVVKRIRYGWLADMDIPYLSTLMEVIWKIKPKCEITVKKVIYPPSVVWSRLRLFYIFAQKIRILNLIPLGYLLIVKST